MSLLSRWDGGESADECIEIPIGRLGRPEEIAETVLWMVKTGYVNNKVCQGVVVRFVVLIFVRSWLLMEVCMFSRFIRRWFLVSEINPPLLPLPSELPLPSPSFVVDTSPLHPSYQPLRSCSSSSPPWLSPLLLLRLVAY